ncbi:flagellar biosynthetic protein FliR [Actibacterium sp. XHP0104]|uniref:flagellar biosynthetic protein FliR n=1 Tax=Actibacterium sp. XHP0104 TaxID=2984335 RepID=UPI0021E978D3|nr:flagellar biosynthetic protein FliR [Actibacterium sp. XHP0104]MCV2881810.1 flagellar biosynthetic protein FliR [Actibacterium sp. XHP0104]
MTVDLAQFLGQGQQVLLAAGIVFLRVGAMIALLPVFGERVVPARVRMALAVCFTLIVAPAASPAIGAALAQGVAPAQFLVSETIVGLAIGIVLRLMILALQITGHIAAQAISLSQLLGAGAGDPQPALGHFLTVAGLALAAMSGLHVAAAETMISSYEVMPAGRILPADVLAEWGVRAVAFSFDLALRLAMPFVVVSLLYNLALGVINRAMPQLMVALVGAPAITAGGMILFALAAPMMLGLWLEQFHHLLADPTGVAR